MLTDEEEEEDLGRLGFKILLQQCPVLRSNQQHGINIRGTAGCGQENNHAVCKSRKTKAWKASPGFDFAA